MNETIKLLEDRVKKAADRIRELSEERRRLDTEVRSLRARVERLEAPEAGGQVSRERWEAQRLDVVATLRETIEELRD